MTRLATIVILTVFALTACATPNYSVSVDPDRVILRLELPRAESVGFASSLDGFKIHDAHRVGTKTWEIQQAADGSFKYFFIVDGFDGAEGSFDIQVTCL